MNKTLYIKKIIKVVYLQDDFMCNSRCTLRVMKMVGVVKEHYFSFSATATSTRYNKRFLNCWTFINSLGEHTMFNETLFREEGVGGVKIHYYQAITKEKYEELKILNSIYSDELKIIPT